MRLKVLHHWTPDNGYSRYAKLTLRNREEYCSRHGYELVADESDKTPSRKYKHVGKFKAIAEHLRDCDWLAWVDVDALLTNGERRLEDMCDDSFSCVQSHYATDDCASNGAKTNYIFHNGVLLVKNDETGRELYGTLADDAFYESMCARFRREYLLDEDMTNFVYANDYRGFAKAFKPLHITSMFSTTWLANKRYASLPVFRPGRFVMHYSNPLPPELKYAYSKAYFDACDAVGARGIYPQELMDDAFLRAIGAKA